MTGTHTLNCDSRLGYQCTCTLQPEPDAGEEWRVFEFQRLRVLNKTGRLVADAQTEAEAAQIVSDHNAVPKLVGALKARVSPTRCYCNVMDGATCADCADRELLARIDELK